MNTIVYFVKIYIFRSSNDVVMCVAPTKLQLASQHSQPLVPATPPCNNSINNNKCDINNKNSIVLEIDDDSEHLSDRFVRFDWTLMISIETCCKCAVYRRQNVLKAKTMRDVCHTWPLLNLLVLSSLPLKYRLKILCKNIFIFFTNERLLIRLRNRKQISCIHRWHQLKFDCFIFYFRFFFLVS